VAVFAFPFKKSSFLCAAAADAAARGEEIFFLYAAAADAAADSRKSSSRMADVKGRRPPRGARSAPLTSVIREISSLGKIFLLSLSFF
jgi:hypothetical protein